jgi:hypothetical protein
MINGVYSFVSDYAATMTEDYGLIAIIDGKIETSEYKTDLIRRVNIQTLREAGCMSTMIEIDKKGTGSFVIGLANIGGYDVESHRHPFDWEA